MLVTIFMGGILFTANVTAGVHYLDEWGIYELDLEDGTVTPVFTGPDELTTIRLDPTSELFAVSMKTGGTGYEHTELYTVGIDGADLTRLTDNEYWDLYPSWSPDGEEIGFLSFRDQTLDIWVTDADGENQRLLYDSGGHDADLHWVGDVIAFTRDSQIWVMNSDGTDARRLTDPPRAGEWGETVLPFGDYDPRVSPDGSQIVFERLVDDSTIHGNYDLFLINIGESSETRLTDSGWTQGLVSWSNDGQKLVYTVSAVGLEGRYDLFLIEPDGSGMEDVTSEIFPPGFMANSAIFSMNDSSIYFIGNWWDWKIFDSVLTCSFTSPQIDLGDTVTISGSLGPLVESVFVQVTVTRPDGSDDIHDVVTDEGNYVLDIKPDQHGVWEAQASWEGDSGHSESTSEVTEIIVREETEPEEPESEADGISGFYLEAILLGLIVYYLKQAFS
ncbi:hypothetical protein HOB36_10670 [Candidatus Bathyarchaeota archaeon]|nr:hypothetical protein [Candidatus Bathyarchaeota archaeon]